MSRPLCIPQDFVHRDELLLLSRNLQPASNSGEFAKIAAAHILTHLWLDWARGGRAHRACPAAGIQQLHYLIAHAAQWPAVARMLGITSEEHLADQWLASALVASGVLVASSAGEHAGYVLNGFAEYNAHLDPDYKSIQSRGGAMKKRNAILRAAANDGGKQLTLLRQSGFLFPSEDSPTEGEQQRAVGLFLQLHISLDLPIPKNNDWPQTLMRDAVQIIRTFQPERLLAIAEWLMERRTDMAETDPGWIIRNFITVAAGVPEERG